MGYNVIDDYDQALSPLRQCENISSDLINDLQQVLYRLHQQNRFSKPMPTIGVYIALASLGCVIAMVADSLHCLQNKIQWFRCKYFTLNAVSLTAIAVAMKLPMDLTTPMPGFMDQEAKLGSVAFMCILMAYLLPSLATMNGKALVTNIIALGLLVITLVVNVCIQINTGLVSYNEETMRIREDMFPGKRGTVGYANRELTIIYVGLLLMLLMIYVCTALMIFKSKHDLESKYQAAHERALIIQQPAGELNVDNLKQCVISYGIMARTGSPQLMIVCSATSTASAVIGLSISWLHIYRMLTYPWSIGGFKACDSDYKWSILAIYTIHSIGIEMGMGVMICRFLPCVTYKLSKQGIWNLMMVFNVESYWTLKLSDWEHSILFPFSSTNFKSVFQKLQVLVLRFFILSQKTIVITCKIIRIIPTLMLIYIFHYTNFVKWLKSPSSVQNAGQQNISINLQPYVLQLQDDVELADITLEIIIKCTESSIQNGEKQQPSNLLELVTGSNGFEGVRRFDSELLANEYPNCWSLPVVTLISIVMSLPNIQREILKSFVNGVSEGLVYVKLVEQSLNNKDDVVTVHKAAERLWLEVEVYHKWLGNNLQDPNFRGKTTIQIVEWFNEKATNMVTVMGSMDICANSMRRIAKTILLFYQNSTDEVSQEELFDELSSMISDILAACLTNLPQVIALKCHPSAIEEREESVHDASMLFGRTSEIINTLQARQLPNMNRGDLPFIDKWRDHLTAPAP